MAERRDAESHFVARRDYRGMRGQPEGAHGGPDVVHRYVAGVLPPGELAAFELHMLECAHCQTAVREGSVIRSALLMAPAAVGSPARPALRRRLVWGMPLAAAAVLVIVQAGRNDPVYELGRMAAAPTFTPMRVRTSETDLARRLDSGMAAYSRGDYANAHEMLSGLVAGNQSPAVRFYAGSAALVAGKQRAAIEELRWVLRDTGAESGARAVPYMDDARYVLAKAWLQLGEVDSAATVLSSAGDLRGRALLDSVRSLRPR